LQPHLQPAHVDFRCPCCCQGPPNQRSLDRRQGQKRRDPACQQCRTAGQPEQDADPPSHLSGFEILRRVDAVVYRNSAAVDWNGGTLASQNGQDRVPAETMRRLLSLTLALACGLAAGAPARATIAPPDLEGNYLKLGFDRLSGFKFVTP